MVLGHYSLSRNMIEGGTRLAAQLFMKHTVVLEVEVREERELWF